MADFVGIQELDPNSIKMLADIQPRAELNEETIRDYQLLYESDPSKLPPGRIFEVGKRRILTRGFHRLTACRRAGVNGFVCEVHRGTMSEARRDAWSDNMEHGLRYSREDKKLIIERIIKDAEYKDMTILDIAKMTGFDRNFVSGVIRSMEAMDYSKDTEEVAGQVHYDEDDPGPQERMEKANGDIEKACREVSKVFREAMRKLADENPWLEDHGRLNTATQGVNAALQTIRSCKGKDVCVKCDGDGCKWCRHTGWMDESTYDSANV